MNVLGLDLAGTTGFAFGPIGGKPLFGTWTVPGFDDRMRSRSFANLYSTIHGVVKANDIKLVVIEAALMHIKRKNKRNVWTPVSAHGERVLVMLSGAAQAACANAGCCNIEMPAPNTWRADVLGNGFPDDPKAASLRYCRMAGWKVEDHNAADALCLWHWGASRLKQKAMINAAR